METFRKFSLLLLLPVLLFSCSDDDDNPVNGGNTPDEATVKYAVETPTDIVSGVQFRIATGDFAELTDVAPDWAETVQVQRPFNAAVFVQFSNTGSTQQPYAIHIYVNDELVKTKQGMMQPNMMFTDSAVHDVPVLE